jgi:hypothetical protein
VLKVTRSRAVNPDVEPHAVLGVDEDASPADVDRAYARRRRLHEVGAQTSEDARAAARRYRAMLDDAYRSLLGADPPAAPPDADATDVTLASRGSTPSRSAQHEWLIALGALVVAYLLVQLPVALGFGLVGAVFGWFAAIGVVACTLVRLRARRR